MDNNLTKSVKRINELYSRAETGNALSEPELREQRNLRDDIINYFKFAINKHSRSKEIQ